jgi:hypothetical protein
MWQALRWHWQGWQSLCLGHVRPERRIQAGFTGRSFVRLNRQTVSSSLATVAINFYTHNGPLISDAPIGLVLADPLPLKRHFEQPNCFTQLLIKT